MPSKYRKGRKVVKCVSCVSLLSQDFTLLKILSLFLFAPSPTVTISFLYFCIRFSTLSQFNRFSSPLLHKIQEERMFFYALRTSGKILLSKHLSIIRAALLTFELSNPSGHIKIVYTKTFIHFLYSNITYCV